MGVTGVVTTRIYCRGGCPARARPANRRPFTSGAAAEAAGFRPCLRCRPDRLPTPGPPLNAPIPVQEAVQLVADGYLDSHGEEQLSQAVGFSARHLRRLFMLHVGATPAAVARSRRAHFARRLLDETDLSMAQVSSAAGFGSPRQMRRTVRSTFRFPPEELRARRSRGDRLATDGGLRLRLPYVPPLTFTAMLEALAERCIPGVEVVDQDSYRRTTLGHDKPGVIEVRDHGDGCHLELIAHLPSWRLIIEEVAACRRLFNLDFDPRALPGASSPMAREGSPVAVRTPGAWDNLELSLLRLVSDQADLGIATRALGRIVERFGTAIPDLGLPGLTHVFPSVDALLGAGPAGLAGCGVPPRAAEALIEFIRRSIEPGGPPPGRTSRDERSREANRAGRGIVRARGPFDEAR